MIFNSTIYTQTGGDDDSICGVDWEKSDSPNEYFIDATFGFGKFVAITQDSAYYSKDGINWVISNITSSSDMLTSITYVRDKFIITKNKNTILYSTNAINWNEGSIPFSDLTDIAYGCGVFVAVGYGTHVAWSKNGINWEEKGTLPFSADWRAVTYGNGKFVAVAYDSNKAAYSEDGIIWSVVNLSSNQNHTDWCDIVYGHGKFIALAGGGNADEITGNLIALSFYGDSNWYAYTDRLPSNEGWYRISYGNGIFIAISFNNKVAHGSKIAYSTVGSGSWANVDIENIQRTETLAYGAGTFVTLPIFSNKLLYSKGRSI